MLKIFLIIYFQVGLGNAIGSCVLNYGYKFKQELICHFFLDLFFWPVCIGFLLSKGNKK